MVLKRVLRGAERKKMYREYLKTEHWRKRREKALMQAGRRCQICGQSGNLEVHHLSYAHLFEERDKDLLVLCPDCHGKQHLFFTENDLMDRPMSKPELDFNHRYLGRQITMLVDEAVKTERERDTPRDYLGASRIGHHCLRALQYEFFNTPKDFPFEGRIYRIFHRGHEGENWMAAWLRRAGFILHTEGVDGKQFGFSTGGGKIRGHCDGVFVGGPETHGPYPRLWECKVLGSKGWNRLSKHGLEKAYPEYFAQVQLYMAYLDLSEHAALFTAMNADTMEIYDESVAFESDKTQELSDRAVTVIRACEAGELLSRCTADEDSFSCRFCSYRIRCWRA